MSIPAFDWDAHWRNQPPRITAADWLAMPEEICRSAEVVDGYVIFMESPSEDHQGAALRLAFCLDRAAAELMRQTEVCIKVRTVYDVRISDVPLTNRKPDVMAYTCLPAGLRPRGTDTLVVIEIVSPSTETVDIKDKSAEYAAAGIGVYWIVRTMNGAVASIELHELVEDRYELRHTYTRGVDAVAMEASAPIPITIGWDELEF